MGKLAIITIGQSPRTDLTPEIAALVPHKTQLLECGALDQLNTAEIKAMEPVGNDEVLTSRLRDGSAVILGREPLIRRLQSLISAVEKQVDVVMLACTGEFPAFIHTTPLIEPDRAIVDAVRQRVRQSGTVGVICPLVEQQEISTIKFAAPLPPTVHITTAVATPYSDDLSPLKAAAKQLQNKGVDFIVLDCMGYTQSMAELVSEISGCPVLLSREVAGQAASESLSLISNT